MKRQCKILSNIIKTDSLFPIFITLNIVINKQQQLHVWNLNICVIFIWAWTPTCCYLFYNFFILTKLKARFWNLYNFMRHFHQPESTVKRSNKTKHKTENLKACVQIHHYQRLYCSCHSFATWNNYILRHTTCWSKFQQGKGPTQQLW